MGKSVDPNFRAFFSSIRPLQERRSIEADWSRRRWSRGVAKDRSWLRCPGLRWFFNALDEIVGVVEPRGKVFEEDARDEETVEAGENEALRESSQGKKTEGY